MEEPRVMSVSRDPMHRFSKTPGESITLVVGIGVEGDAHAGPLVKHRSRVRRDPEQVNLRQVHLIHSELFAEAAALGYELHPGDLGENVLTAGIDLLQLGVDTRLHFGELGEDAERAVIRVTGLRNPCAQINTFRPGLLKVVLSRADGTPTDEPAPSTGSTEALTSPVIRKAGVMAVVEHGGVVRPGQRITVIPAPGERRPLEPV